MSCSTGGCICICRYGFANEISLSWDRSIDTTSGGTIGIGTVKGFFLADRAGESAAQDAVAFFREAAMTFKYALLYFSAITFAEKCSSTYLRTARRSNCAS